MNGTVHKVQNSQMTTEKTELLTYKKFQITIIKIGTDNQLI